MVLENAEVAYRPSYVPFSMTAGLMMMMMNLSPVFFIHLPFSRFLRVIRYSTFVRIGSGLSYSDFVWIRDKPWKAWNAQQQPSFLLTANRSHEDKGDMFLEPEEYGQYLAVTWVILMDIFSSFVLKIKAAEIVPSGLSHCFV
jgi:hypothetical protein